MAGLNSILTLFTFVMHIPGLIVNYSSVLVITKKINVCLNLLKPWKKKGKIIFSHHLWLPFCDVAFQNFAYSNNSMQFNIKADDLHSGPFMELPPFYNPVFPNI